MASHRLSVFVSKILRHNPELVDVELAPDGSCRVDTLLMGINSKPNWNGVTVEDLKEIVDTDEKQRYSLINGRIKANYGHSCIKVAYQSQVPPEILLHGTSLATWEKIRTDGMRSMNRSYVHLSASRGFAVLAGRRKSKVSSLVLLHVQALEAHNAGTIFYLSDNAVWLAEYVSPEFISVGEVVS
jgi:putative RNA 2'-phosphotransferase